MASGNCGKILPRGVKEKVCNLPRQKSKREGSSPVFQGLEFPIVKICYFLGEQQLKKIKAAFCTVWAMSVYVRKTAGFRRTDQLFVSQSAPHQGRLFVPSNSGKLGYASHDYGLFETWCCSSIIFSCCVGGRRHQVPDREVVYISHNETPNKVRRTVGYLRNP